MQNRMLRSYLAMIGLAVLCGCGAAGSTGQPGTVHPAEPPSGAAAALPAPSQLKLAPRRASAVYTEGDLVQTGAAFDPALPHNFAVVNGASCDFSPAWTGNTDPAGGLAYASYHFAVPGFDRAPQVRLAWGTAPGAPGCWFALANWTRDRWDWYAASPSGITSLASMAKYLNFSGDLVAVVLCTGTDPASLASLRLSGPAPVAAAVADKPLGRAPLTVNFDASSSTTEPGTAITKYEWDLDDDSVYETDTGATPAASQTFPSNGSHRVRLRVTNSLNAKADEAIDVQAIGPWTHTWGLGNNEQIEGIVTDEAGNIYCAGYLDDPANPPLCYKIVIMKYTPTGTLLWAQTWTNGGNDCYGSALGMDGSGNLIVAGSAGTSGAAGTQALVQKWSREGLVLETWLIGGADRESFSAIAMRGDTAYLTGSSTDASFNQSILTASFDTAAGALNWAREYTCGDMMSGDISYTYNSMFDTTVVYVGANETTTNIKPVLLVYSSDGSLSKDKVFNAPKSLEARAVEATYDLLNGTNIYLACTSRESPYGLIQMCFNSSFAMAYANRWSSSNEIYVNDLLFDGAGHLLTVGWMLGLVPGEQYAALWKIDPSDGTTLNTGYWSCTGDAARAETACLFEGGLLLGGFAPQAGGSWASLGGSDTAYTVSWVDASGTSANAGISAYTTSGVVESQSAGVIDSGAGRDDVLLMYRDLP